MNPNHQTGTGASASDAIEAKMQTLEAKLRQERDKARRAYELATERIGLLRTEVEVVETAVQDRQKLLSSIVNDKQKIEEKLVIRTTVESLTKEVRLVSTAKISCTSLSLSRIKFSYTHFSFWFYPFQCNFQHAEISGKREKLQQLQESMREATRTRQKKLRDTTTNVTERRGRLEDSKSASLRITQKERLLDELEDGIIRERFERDWPDFVEYKDKMYQAEIAHLQQEDLPTLQRILKRYAEQFGLDDMMEPAPVPADGEAPMEEEEKESSD